MNKEDGVKVNKVIRKIVVKVLKDKGVEVCRMCENAIAESAQTLCSPCQDHWQNAEYQNWIVKEKEASL